MKKTLIILLAAIAIMSSSCSQEERATVLRLEMDKGIRTIAPDVSKMEICSYRVVLTSPEGIEWGERLTYHSFCSFENLYPGKWHIAVYGQNTSRTDIAYGEIETELAEGENSAYVEVKNLIGKGSLEVRITWDSDKVKDPVIKLFLAKQGEEELEITAPSADKTEGEATLFINSLESGSYMLRGELYSNASSVGGFAEAIRITNGELSRGSVVMVKTGNPESSDSITVSDMTSIPLEGEISGVNPLVATNSRINASVLLSTKNVKAEDLDVKWYIDGIYKASGLDYSFISSDRGLHRIDAVFSTATVGSAGSASATFSVVDNVKEGMPYQMTPIKSMGEFTLTEDHAASFLPNGRIIIADNQEDTLTVLERDSNGKFTFYITPYSSIKAENSTVTDIVAAGTADDSSSTVYLICNDPAEIIAIRYTARNNLMSWIRTEDSIYDSSDMNLIRTLGPGELFRNENGSMEFVFAAAATKNNEHVGLLTLTADAKSGESFIISNQVSQSIYEGYAIEALEADWNASTLLCVSPATANVYHIYYRNDSPVLESNPILYDGDKSSDRVLFYDGLSGRITDYDEGTGYLLHGSGLIMTTRVPGVTTSIETSGNLPFLSTNYPVPFIEGSKDGEYYYIFDKYGKKLYMAIFEEKYGFDRNSGNDFIILDNTLYDEMEISHDGKSAIIKAEGKLPSFLLLDIIR